MSTQPTDLQRSEERAPIRTDRPPAQGSGASKGRAPPPRMPPRSTWLTFLVILVANFILVRLLFPGAGAPVKVP